MSDATSEKTNTEKARDIVTQLKEMQHYAKTNVEKLAGFWLVMEEEVKIEDFAQKVDELLRLQNEFQDKLDASISDIEISCNRIENEETETA